MSHTMTVEPNIDGNQPTFLQQVKAQKLFSPENAKAATTLGALQLAAGALAIVFEVTAIVVTRPMQTLNGIGVGIGCGALYMLAGLLGVLAGKKNQKNLIVSYLVFNILISVITWALVGLAALQLAVYTTYRHAGQGVINGLLLFLAIFEFIVSIAAAAYCCKALQCCCSGATPASLLLHGMSTQGNTFAHGSSMQQLAEKKESCE